jgi:hypothetical protein
MATQSDLQLGKLVPRGKDIFLSHTGVDKPWVEDLAELLERVRFGDRYLGVVLDKWDFEIGKNVVLEIDRYIDECRFIALVVTKAFLDAEWPTLERTIAVGSDPSVVVVVNVRHRHGGGVAKDFRVVKLCATRIAMRPEDLAHRVAKPGPPAALPTAKVSRVLVKDYREDAFGHVIPNNKVGVGSAEVLRISFNTLPERTITVAELALARKCRGECECATVEGVLSGNSELLARRR